jgi:hypothetical protein
MYQEGQMPMSKMTVRGQTASDLLLNIGDQIELTWSARTRCRPAARASGEDDIRLWSFLANARFGQDEIRANGLSGRLEYHRRMVSWQPDACMLLRPDEPLQVDIHTDDGQYVEFVLHDGIGYSSVIPLTQTGYEEYSAGRVSAFSFDFSHVFHSERNEGVPRYILVEGLLNFPTLGTNRLSSPDVVLEGIEPGGYRLIRLLIEHIARYTPGIVLDASGLLSRELPGELPVFLCDDNGGMGAKLSQHAGFLDTGKFDKDGHPIFELDLADFNILPAGDTRRVKMERPLDALVSFCKNMMIYSKSSENPSAADRSTIDNGNGLGRLNVR